jgi:hypothetical protein
MVSSYGWRSQLHNKIILITGGMRGSPSNTSTAKMLNPFYKYCHPETLFLAKCTSSEAMPQWLSLLPTFLAPKILSHCRNLFLALDYSFTWDSSSHTLPSLACILGKSLQSLD